MLTQTNMEAKEKNGRESTSNFRFRFVIFKRGLIARVHYFEGKPPIFEKRKLKEIKLSLIFLGCTQDAL